MKSSTETLIAALRILSRDIESDDGVANAAIAEAADRLAELSQAAITPAAFCDACGKRNQGVHTCSPAWALEQADRVRADVPSDKFLDLLNGYGTSSTAMGKTNAYREILSYIDAHCAQQVADWQGEVQRMKAANEIMIARNLELKAQLAARIEPAAVIAPKWVGEFSTFDEWVRRARQVLASPAYRPAICIDAKGRRCTLGKDMMIARDEGDFPVRYFWEFEIVIASQPSAQPAPEELAAASWPLDEQVAYSRAKFSRSVDPDGFHAGWFAAHAKAQPSEQPAPTPWSDADKAELYSILAEYPPEAKPAPEPIPAQTGTAAPENFEQDLLDIVRTFCHIAQRMTELTASQRENYPSPLSSCSPVLMAAQAACIERGYTEWGLAIEGVTHPSASPAAPEAKPAEGK